MLPDVSDTPDFMRAISDQHIRTRLDKSQNNVDRKKSSANQLACDVQ